MDAHEGHSLFHAAVEHTDWGEVKGQLFATSTEARQHYSSLSRFTSSMMVNPVGQVVDYYGADIDKGKSRKAEMLEWYWRACRNEVAETNGPYVCLQHEEFAEQLQAADRRYDFGASVVPHYCVVCSRSVLNRGCVACKARTCQECLPNHDCPEAINAEEVVSQTQEMSAEEVTEMKSKHGDNLEALGKHAEQWVLQLGLSGAEIVDRFKQDAAAAEHKYFVWCLRAKSLIEARILAKQVNVWSFDSVKEAREKYKTLTNFKACMIVDKNGNEVMFYGVDRKSKQGTTVKEDMVRFFHAKHELGQL
jgi:hypothetical protein